jgi:hypothetical protein
MKRILTILMLSTAVMGTAPAETYEQMIEKVCKERDSEITKIQRQKSHGKKLSQSQEKMLKSSIYPNHDDCQI